MGANIQYFFELWKYTVDITDYEIFVKIENWGNFFNSILF
jgi:hypothetical protein